MTSAMYIHIPFCETLCSYCDFCKCYYYPKWVIPYLDTLKKEIDTYYHKEKISTLYVGGGTPSSLSEEELEVLLTMLDKISKTKDIEYTFECNIENITERKIQQLKSHGVNRISVGIQTFHEKYLSFLNRHHTKEEAIWKIKMIKKYIPNVNVDLMYAFPSQTIEELKEDIQILRQLDVPHISTYSLMIEEHTPLFLKGVKPISEDLDSTMYETILEMMKDYHHYEISNFAIPGYESRHNLTYWNNLEYFGFGVGASGYVKDIRYTNTKSLSHYMQGLYRYQEEKISEEEKMQNEFILGFRKMDGISISNFIQKYGFSPLSLTIVQKLLEEKKLETDSHYLWIAKPYIYTSNDILLNFIEDIK